MLRRHGIEVIEVPGGELGCGRTAGTIVSP
jgi:arginine deiminase